MLEYVTERKQTYRSGIEYLTTRNSDKDPLYYDLRYGSVHTEISSDIQHILSVLIRDKGFQLLQGEIELWSMALWRLTSQDLIHYNENLKRRSKTKLLIHLLQKCLRTFDNLTAQNYTRTSKTNN